MSQTFRVFRETALPATLVPYSVYFIAPASNPDLVEIYVTSATATAPQRHVINKTEIQSMIDTSIQTASQLTIVADIAARDALVVTKPTYVFVTDATGDTTVLSGGATYLYNPATTSWLKTSEAESMDFVISWDGIINKPSSTVAQIDDAVSKTHTHANKTELDGLGKNASGELTFENVQVKTEWSNLGW